MQKPRLAAIEYIRGISMLGVIGIHVGSQYLVNATANIHLIALLEIATRFSVPIFFFISAFGLFYNLDMSAVFNYKTFMYKRFRTVLIPYFTWSFFYLLFYAFLNHNFAIFAPSSIASCLFFGLACYQLYFLVILLWFYLLMPLWIYIVKHIAPFSLCLLLLFQIAFDYFSSFNTSFNTFVYDLENPLIRSLFIYRLNYWVLHYIFIFILGGYLAVHINSFKIFMKRYRLHITIFFWLTLVSLLAYYYQLIFNMGYKPEAAINTAHQLCPAGILYTIAASIFFFTIFTYQHYPQKLNTLLSFCGYHSYFAYLVHPVAISFAAVILHHYNIVMSAPVTIIYYIFVASAAICAASLARRIGNHLPLLNIMTIGVYPRPNKK